MSKRFHLGDVLSITTHVLVSPDYIGGIYNILNYLTGDQLMTHQLPAAADVMTPYLTTQFPELALIEVPEFTSDDQIDPWLAEQVAIYGEWHEVTAPPSSFWGEHDALQEAVDLIGADRVITVEIPLTPGDRHE